MTKGTSTLTICSLIVKNGHAPDPRRTDLLRLDGQEDTIMPQTLAFLPETQTKQHRLVYGFPAIEMAMPEENDQLATKPVIIEGLKTMLFPSDEAGNTRTRQLEQLGEVLGSGYDLFWVLSTHLDQIRKDAIRAILSPEWLSKKGFTKNEMLSMTVETFFPVPESTDPGRRRLMRQAIDDAGWENKRVMMVSETQAAGKRK